jgi:hypothetical protein
MEIARRATKTRTLMGGAIVDDDDRRFKEGKVEKMRSRVRDADGS